MYETDEDLEIVDVLDDITERLNVERTKINGETKVFVHKGYASRHLYEIEKFVKKIEATGWKCGFVEEITRYAQVTKIRKLYLGAVFYPLINEWLEHHSDTHRYSERIEAFYGVCKELGLIGRDHFQFEQPGDVAGVGGMRCMDWFNLLIEKVHARCQTREFKERERLREENADRNVENVLAMEKAMFEVKSRWLILSLTLCYEPKYRRWITPQTIQDDRDRFFAARRFNGLMMGIKNYAWGIEQGKKAGLHMHVILFYSGEHNRDEFIADQIGKYWVDVVTKGKGDSWSSNQRRLKNGYERKGHGVGVGQIDRKDRDKREALCKNLSYPAKAEQYLLIKGAEGMHTFGMGTVPEKEKSGRPRSLKPKLDGDPAGSTQADSLGSTGMDTTKPDTDQSH